MTLKHVLIPLGGLWHPFEGFAAFTKALFEPAGYIVESTYDLDSLARLPAGGYDLVVSYTSLSKHREGMNDTTPEGLTDAQVDGLTRWVRAGGGLLAVHSATVVGNSNPAYEALLGGAFISHPPQFAFTVYPLSREHPITAGIEAFTVHDEFYIQRYDPSVDIHMIALDRGIAHPMVWTKTAGAGRVAHIALGHSERVWSLPLYERLLFQAAAWLLDR
ncbi:MAG: ThuA domain-containing protein [Chloroflexi bacterium]|nr:ThuA domain-containing protein [Chloroflexota bacterium]